MSGSLLLIAVVWIVLLAPLLLRHQSPVRRTAQALTETRVVHEGGAELPRTRRLKPADSLYSSSDDDAELELVEAEPEFFLVDDEASRGQTRQRLGSRFGMGRGKSTATADAKATAQGDAQLVANDAEIVDAELVELSDLDDATDTGSSRSAQADNSASNLTADSEEGAATANEVSEGSSSGDSQGTQDAAEAEIIDGEVVSESDDEQGEQSSATPGVARPVSNDPRFRSQDAHDTNELSPVRLVVDGETGEQGRTNDGEESDSSRSEHTAELDDSATRTPRRSAISVAYFRGSDLDTSTTVAEDERGVAEQHSITKEEAQDLDEGRDELDDADMAYLAARKGRGVYDPVASTIAAKRRQHRRKQVLGVLVALCLVTLGAGIVLGGNAWVATGLAFAFTAVYLYFLRKSALEEQRMRSRRIARMRRARLGVRNTEDEELGVPNRLRRPGAIIVESDDNDPDFEHLDYAHGSDFFASPEEDGHHRGTRQHGLAYSGHTEVREHIRAV